MAKLGVFLSVQLLSLLNESNRRLIFHRLPTISENDFFFTFFCLSIDIVGFDFVFRWMEVIASATQSSSRVRIFSRQASAVP